MNRIWVALALVFSLGVASVATSEDVNKFVVLGIVLMGLAVAGFLVWLSRWLKDARRARLVAKYGDLDLVDRIMKRRHWLGQTAEQLRESLGVPAGKDQKLLKTNTREVWKYEPLGARRYGLRITLEDGVVVGWDTKD